MPKAKRQTGAAFVVSPWQDQRADAARPAAQSNVDTDYSEVELPLVVSGSGGSHGRPTVPALPMPNPDGSSSAMALDASPEFEPEGQSGHVTAVVAAAVAAPAAAAGSSSWITKKRKTAASKEMKAKAAGAGHLVCTPSAFSPARCLAYGLMGEVVVAGRECTRDTDWGVLRMTLVSFVSGGSGGSSGGGGSGDVGVGGMQGGGEVSFLVERTEGDAMRLRAPVPWQGVELEELPMLDAACTCGTTSGLALDFLCQQLLSGAAGDALLRRLQPSLAGCGAALNVGGMQLVLPPDAAAALLLPAAAVGRGGQAGSGSANSGAGAMVPEAPTQESLRKVLTGSGNDSGRAVRDTGDDW